ncbi:MAG: hypothetical protein ACRDRH_27605, partial [Pseudonocardia sp.]
MVVIIDDFLSTGKGSSTGTDTPTSGRSCTSPESDDVDRELGFDEVQSSRIGAEHGPATLAGEGDDPRSGHVSHRLMFVKCLDGSLADGVHPG